MTDVEELSLPTRHGEVLWMPEFARWLSVAAATAGHLDACRVFGQPLRSLREQARAEAVERAWALLERWGFPTPPPLRGPWVATGHQPSLYHPGIWIKAHALDASVGLGAVGLYVVVDSDECEGWGARVPRRDGALRAAQRTLVHCGPGVPFEAMGPPAEQGWRAFCAQLRDDVATLDVPELVERLTRAERAGLHCLPVVRSLGEFGAALRRRLEAECGPVRYWEVTVSELSRTPSFGQFAAWLAQDAERFWACHNQALDDYRRAHAVRSSVQPFPNLRRDGEWVELPFWFVRDGQRRPVFTRAGGSRVVYCDGQPVGELSGGPLDGLRPRALTLTLFLRLLVCDLFVHGLGGARYDRVTDQVLRQFFGLEPPPFAVLTATFHLPLARHADPKEAYAAAHQLWLDLQHNPDRHLPASEPARALAEEKWRCIRALQSPDLTRSARRELTHRIRALNEALRAPLQHRIREVESQLEALRREVEEHQVASDRNYPFFLFDPEQLRAPFRTTEEVRCSR
ncbi:MAG: hypothetical protein RMM30_11255 [Armatimonadota bacterium]|nr:hypothetical protein [Armatimonadota bacterium]MDW8157148.1 hypothetical protein [Armatimonadota bacterium]